MHKESLYTQQVLSQRSYYTQQAFTQRNFYTHTHTVKLFTHTHRDAFTQRNFTQRDAFTQREAFSHRKLHTQQAFAQQAFTQRSFWTENAFTHIKFLHAESFYTQQASTRKIFYTQQTFTERSFYTEKLSCTAWQQKLQLQNRISAPKQEKHDFEALCKRNLKIQIASSKIKKICWLKTLSQPWCSHSNTIYECECFTDHTLAHPLNCRGGVVARNDRLQPLYREQHKVSCSGFLPKTKPMQQSCSHYNAFCSTTYTPMQPLQCDLHPHVAEHQGRTDSTPKRPQPHLPHTGGTFHRRLQPNYTTYTSMQPLQCDLHPHVAEHQGRTDSTPKRPQPHLPHTGGTFHRRLQPNYTTYTSMQPLQCDLHPHVAEHQGRRSRARHTQDTLHGNTQDLVLRLPPQNKAHATIMPPLQSLQCVLQHHVANLHVSTHMATEHDQNQTAITVRSAVRD